MTKDEELNEAIEWWKKSLNSFPDNDRELAKVLAAYHHHRLEVEREKMKKKTIENLIG